MAETGTIEREVKLSVWPGFALPNLDGVIDGEALATEASNSWTRRTTTPRICVCCDVA
jgi:hypothetical protein